MQLRGPAGQPGVVAVSLSYGFPEANLTATPSITSLNTTYLASGAAANVAVTISTGDSSTPSFPATTPNVIAVGGTIRVESSDAGTSFIVELPFVDASLATAVQAFAVAALVTVLWFMVGYSLAFTHGGDLNPVIGSLSRAFGRGLLGSTHELAKTVPDIRDSGRVPANHL